MKELPTNINAEHIIQAIHKINKEGIPAQAHSSTYDVLFEGEKYPPKLVLSYANIFANGEELNRNTFDGGLETPCFKLLEKNGFNIVRKNSIPETLELFLHQAYTSDLKTKKYIKFFEGLKVKVSFGIANSARIPWIAFLADGQVPLNGIYPVFLFYKKYKILVLAYGISETNEPPIMWNVINKATTIQDYFKQKDITPDRYGNSFIYKVYDTTKKLDFNSIEIDLKHLINEYKMTLNSTENKITYNKQFKTSVMKKNLSLSSFITDLSSTGLIFSDQLVIRFVLSLLTKPFVILSGLAGSGKTQLAISFARWICEKSEEQICIVPVGADWTNREFLLGYPNALNNKEYVKPDNGVLDLLINANMNKDKPYFLILDEMNLSYVERYFADFLSAMESCEKIPLMKNSENNAVPESISLPKNLFIIGTINVDETTYMFSPKVLDRANVVEFRIMPDELDTFFKNMKPIDKDIINGMGTSQAYSFVEIANSKADIQTIENRNEIILILKQFFIELKNIHAEFGYRTANEMFRFMSLGQKLETSLSSDMIVDAAIIQKLLPKLHGSRKKIEPVLKALWSLCINNNKYALDTISELPGENEMKYPLSAEKIWRMYRIAQDNGFTSFAEA